LLSDVALGPFSLSSCHGHRRNRSVRGGVRGTNIWVTNQNSNTASKINPATNTVIAAVAVGTGPRGVAFDGTDIWVTNFGSGNVSKINPATTP